MNRVLPPRAAFQRAAFIPAGFAQAICAGCQAGITVPADMSPPLCMECQRSQALADVHKLLCEIRDLKAGNGLYGLLSTEERDEQLIALGMPPANAKSRYPGFANVPSDVLITIVADPQETAPYDDRDIMVAEALQELCKRLEMPTDPAPSPREQEQIERQSIVLAGEPEDPERWDLV